MNKKLTIISDIHGCYYTLQKLLSLCPKRPVIFNGDLVDRGPWSRQVVEYAIKNKIPTVMGNHEDLLLYGCGISNKCGYSEEELWMINGGRATIESYGGTIQKDHIQWIEERPSFFMFGDLMISHTGFGDNLTPREALWRRAAPENDGRYYVIGHTPAKSPMFFDHYAMIDTGAAYSSRGFGHMTAFLWPEKKFITIPTAEKDLTAG